MSREIVITETAGIARAGEYVRAALPCRRGEWLPQQPLAVVDESGRELPCQSRLLKAWPDGSAKWLLLDFPATVGANGSGSFRVRRREGSQAPPPSVLTVIRGADQWRVATGAATFAIDTRSYRPFTSVSAGGRQLLSPRGSFCRFRLAAGADLLSQVDSVELEEEGALHSVVLLRGRFLTLQQRELRFTSRLHFYAGSSAARIEFTLHNPHPARHKGGLWDLGDPGSVLFEEFSFSFDLALAAAVETQLRCEPGGAALASSAELPVSLCQESSGGENWRSANHRSRDGKVRLSRKGYLATAGAERLQGLRATPLIWTGNAGLGVSATMQHFWQEFPKAIAVEKHSLKLSLFPGSFPGGHELQGGERKTHSFMIDFASAPDGLAWASAPLEATASPEDYRESGIFHDLPGEGDLIDQLISAEVIREKREVLDEYGWRNFGELYADHEAVYHQGEETFVSHYNNQYDFVAGAYRKAFATGDRRWRELAADLARHVLDIDLYHTDGDREEYNRGLFWHTDHYLDAGASSHRSFSKQHLKMKAPHLCGGGPGAEHCYTTGLMLHYFQTGNGDFRDVVIALARWELLALTGPQTVLAAAKRGVASFKSWRASRGERRLLPRYPLTRGTGNAITACLDAFEVGGGRGFLDKAAELIRGTIHPNDDIAARDLLNAEVAWSYTVLLGAVVKFLHKKMELAELDASFQHARASLLVYAEWMLENEYPYLEKPELLEYPNETWAAQDLRKSVIFYHAARFASSQKRAALLDRAIFFYETSRSELFRHERSRFVRPLVLMLQNGWVGSRLSLELPVEPEVPVETSEGCRLSTPSLSLAAVAAHIRADLGEVVKQTSVARELAWLRARLTD